MKKVLFTSFLFYCCCFSASAQLTITELMASNSSTLIADGDYYDWIELHNASNVDIDLSSYTLSDDQDENATASRRIGISKKKTIHFTR